MITRNMSVDRAENGGVVDVLTTNRKNHFLTIHTTIQKGPSLMKNINFFEHMHTIISMFMYKLISIFVHE